MHKKHEKITFVPVRPVANGQTVLIQVGEGTIWAQPNGGSLRAPVGTLIHWSCREPFSICFTQLGGAPQPWPSPKVTEVDGMYQATSEPPEFPRDASGPYYSYTVSVGDLTLDPIVIVDKT